MSIRYSLIETPEALQQALLQFETDQWLTVDTEFQRERTYRAKLCLVQVGNGRFNALFDAIKLDLQPLWNRLARTDTLKVMHSADQDNEVFVQLTGACFQPLFDTQIAATLLGIGDQIGYAGLVKAQLGIEIDKRMARTDWTRRPLSEAALAYAAADVHHLAEIYPQLQAGLEQRGRQDWLAEDSARLCETERYLANPNQAWKRLKGLGRLQAGEQHIAAALAAWRETQAEQKDKPRRWILPDAAILILAQRQPHSAQDIADLNIEGVSERLCHVLAESVLPTAYGAQQPEPLVVDQGPEETFRRRFKKLSAALRERAEALSLPPGFLGPRADLERLLTHGAQADIPLLTGWRREQAGKDLLEVREQILRATGE